MIIYVWTYDDICMVLGTVGHVRDNLWLQNCLCLCASCVSRRFPGEESIWGSLVSHLPRHLGLYNHSHYLSCHAVCVYVCDPNRGHSFKANFTLPQFTQLYE